MYGVKYKHPQVQPNFTRSYKKECIHAIHQSKLYIELTCQQHHSSLFVFKGDECSNYKVLSSATRAQGYTARNNVRCDRRDLSTPGWYRFMGAAGDQIPDKCVPVRRCGTHAPGWLNGAHPSVQDGVVTRQVCYHWSNNCCRWNNNIKVRNCGGFYVYELPRTPLCYLRYCGNAGAGKLIDGFVI